MAIVIHLSFIHVQEDVPDFTYFDCELCHKVLSYIQIHIVACLQAVHSWCDFQTVFSNTFIVLLCSIFIYEGIDFRVGVACVERPVRRIASLVLMYFLMGIDSIPNYLFH